MYPQYAQRNFGGEIAIWLLLTIGALLIPIIIIAVCCIRRHWQRRPHIKLMEIRTGRMMMMPKQSEGLRSYNGPYTESGNDDQKSIASNFSHTNSFKKQHVHWPDGSITPKIDDNHNPPPYPHENHFTMLTESPSSHRRPVNSNLSHFIQTAIIPAGSTISSVSASQLLTPSKDFTSISAGFNSVM